MIISCEQCHTRFKVGDDKFANGPIRVRCSKCNHVFLASGNAAHAAATAPPPTPPPGAAPGPITGFFKAADLTAQATSSPPPQQTGGFNAPGNRSGIFRAPTGALPVTQVNNALTTPPPMQPPSASLPSTAIVPKPGAAPDPFGALETVNQRPPPSFPGTPSFAQPQPFGQPSPFGQPLAQPSSPPSFGQPLSQPSSPPSFGQPLAQPSSPPSFGQPQPFGQPAPSFTPQPAQPPSSSPPGFPSSPPGFPSSPPGFPSSPPGFPSSPPGFPSSPPSGAPADPFADLGASPRAPTQFPATTIPAGSRSPTAAQFGAVSFATPSAFPRGATPAPAPSPFGTPAPSPFGAPDAPRGATPAPVASPFGAADPFGMSPSPAPQQQRSPTQDPFAGLAARPDPFADAPTDAMSATALFGGVAAGKSSGADPFAPSESVQISIDVDAGDIHEEAPAPSAGMIPPDGDPFGGLDDPAADGGSLFDAPSLPPQAGSLAPTTPPAPVVSQPPRPAGDSGRFQVPHTGADMQKLKRLEKGQRAKEVLWAAAQAVLLLAFLAVAVVLGRGGTLDDVMNGDLRAALGGVRAGGDFSVDDAYVARRTLPSGIDVVVVTGTVVNTGEKTAPGAVVNVRFGAGPWAQGWAWNDIDGVDVDRIADAPDAAPLSHRLPKSASLAPGERAPFVIVAPAPPEGESATFAVVAAAPPVPAESRAPR